MYNLVVNIVNILNRSFEFTGLGIIVTSAKKIMFSSLFVCLSVSNFARKLPNGFVWNF